jgi:hypothetical protein
MLTSLQSTMLNVFQTRPGEGLLHDEISNFVSFQQDQFAVFQRRMEFLSDTAGALGLMGTVWGMFTVFFQGSAEQDVILRGMGIALITTLLGLVVSIILNLSATELSTFFSKRVEQVSRKSDELRFRLMELAPEPKPIRVSLPSAVSAPAPAPVAAAEAPAPKTKAPPPPPTPSWRHIEFEEMNGAYPAGSVLDPLKLVVRGPDGEPVSGVPVLISVAGAGGSLDDGRSSMRATSDKDGRVGVSCRLPERAGTVEFDVSVHEQPGPPTRLRLVVGAGAPERLEAKGNHQAAVAGMRLPLPLAVRVLDRFGNPVPGAQVDFRVKHGAGLLGSGSTELRAATDTTGLASTPFVVASEAGPNRVEATVAGAAEAIEFTAFGTEV